MFKQNRFLSFLVAALVGCAMQASAQEPKPETMSQADSTLRVTSRLVVLDVVVTDKSGANRNNLTKDDFHVTEGGVPQTILNFEPPSAHTLPPITVTHPVNSTADLEREAPQAPVNIIVLDEMNTAFNDMAFARYALKKYLNANQGEVLTPTMLAVVTFDGFKVLHDYTQDRKSILDALDHHLTRYPWNLQRGESPILNFAKSLGALEQVAQGTAGHPGHKNVIWVGKGFKGLNLNNPNLPASTVAGVGFAVRTAVNMLRESRITLYSIDPTILSSTISSTVDDDSIAGVGDTMDATAPDPFEGDVNFTALAKASGGKAFYNRNDVDRLVGQSVRDGQNYYTITYRPTDPTDAEKAFRKIRVTFTMSGLHAGYRDGYYTKANDVAAPAAGRTTYDMHAAESSSMVYTGLHVLAEPKPGEDGTYIVGVPQTDLVWTADGDSETSKIMVAGVLLDGRDKVLRRETVEVTAKRALGAPGAGYAKLEIKLAPDPAGYRMRFIVRGDADGKIGSADLKVPGAPPPPKPKR